MTNILRDNANNLFNIIINSNNILSTNQYLKNKIKVFIYLYLTDNLIESSSNPLYYNEPNVKTIFDRIIKYIITEMNSFSNLVDDINEITYIKIYDSQYDKNGNGNLFKNKRLLNKHKYRNNNSNSISNSNSNSNSNNEYTDDVIREFMKPYTNFENPISKKIYELIIDIKSFELAKEYNIKKIQKNNLSLRICNISILQNKLFDYQTINNAEPNVDMIYDNLKSLETLKGELFKYTNDINMLYNNYSEMAYYIKQNEHHYKYKKEYCKKTILLDVNRMIKILSTDIINNIKSFVDPDFLEKIRISGIKYKYFTFPRQKMNDLLNNLSVNQLHLLLDNNLYTLYNLQGYEYDDDINSISDTVDFISHYEVFTCHPFYDRTARKMTKKKRIIKNILNDERLINYYDFQRDLYFINKWCNNIRQYEKNINNMLEYNFYTYTYTNETQI